MVSRYEKYLAPSASVLFGVLSLLTISPAALPQQTVKATIDPSRYHLTLSTVSDFALSLQPTPSGKYGITTNQVSINTDSPSGFKIALSASGEDSNIYLGGTESSNPEDIISATAGTIAAPAALSDNSWGVAVAGGLFDQSYNVSNPGSTAKFASVPVAGQEKVIYSQAIPTSGTQNIDIYYGVKANLDLVTGNYPKTINYYAVTDVTDLPGGEEMNITPGAINAGNAAQLSINTSLSTNLHLGDVAVNLTNGGNTYACPNITITTQNPFTLSCQVPNDLPAGEYDVSVVTGIWSHTETAALDIRNVFTLQYAANKPAGVTADVVLPENTVEYSTNPSVAQMAVDIEGLPTLEGYDFIGYAETDGATTATYEYTPGTPNGSFDPVAATVTANTTKTLYAVWQKSVNTFERAYWIAGKSKQNGYYQMQDMSSDICSNVENSTSLDGSDTMSAQLIDTRDNKIYWVSKLADGECWMTQNLDYDLSVEANRSLSTSSSDVAADTTLALNTWGTAMNGVYYVSPGANYLPGGNGETTPTSGLAADSVNWHYSMGAFYSWNAATAKSSTSTAKYSNAPGSICPKGWTLPTAYDSSTDPGDFTRLYESYGGSSLTIAALNAAPLYFVNTDSIGPSGQYNPTHAGGAYWSRTVQNQFGVYSMYFLGDPISPVNTWMAPDYGLPMRCIAK